MKLDCFADCLSLTGGLNVRCVYGKRPVNHAKIGTAVKANNSKLYYLCCPCLHLSLSPFLQLIKELVNAQVT